MTEQITEAIWKHNGLPLRLAFDPDSIREHFDESDVVGAASDEDLMEVAVAALSDDTFYKAYHDVLVRMIEDRLGPVPTSDLD